MKLVYIHGIHGTANSFNHIRGKLGERADITMGYNSEHGFHVNHARMLKGLFGENHLLFIGHGLGGIHALFLAHALRSKVLGGITLSTPFGGCESANPNAQEMWDIHTNSRVIEKVQTIPLMVPWINLVSTGGNSLLLPQPNDGIVSRASMRHRRDMNLLEIDCNHFEILQHKETVATIEHEIEMFELAMGIKQTEMLSATALAEPPPLALDMGLLADDLDVVSPTTSPDAPACLTCRYGAEQMDGGIYCQVFAAITCAGDTAAPYFKSCNPLMPAQSLRMRHLDDDLGGWPAEVIEEIIEVQPESQLESPPESVPVAIELVVMNDGDAVQDQAAIDDLFG